MLDPSTTRLPRITPENLPMSNEQKAVLLLEHIASLLEAKPAAEPTKGKKR